MFNGKAVLDVHSHVRTHVPTSVFLKALLATNASLPSPLIPGSERPMWGMTGMTDEDFISCAGDHANYIDARHIDAQILGPHPVDVNGWMAPHLFKAWTVYVNDMIFKICQARPDRWVGACQLPQIASEKDTSHVLAELDRCVSDYNFVATYVSPDITGRRDSPGMNDPYWFPLYEYCEDSDIPIIVHGTDTFDPRLRAIAQGYQLGYASEQFLATQLLRHSDVFERYPKLRVLICHCGGSLDRLTTDSAFVNPHPDRDLSSNLFFDTCAYDLDFLAASIKQRGVSQSCFGVEAPGSGMTKRGDSGRTADDMLPLFAEDSRLSFLSDADRTDIFYNNPRRFCPRLAEPAKTNALAKLKAY